MPHQPSAPVYASFPSEKLTIGAGVAIFHLASARVVVCYHSRDQYWFLPKGRKNANEDVTTAAQREGFEESGYRNRLLPLPFKHRATDPNEGHLDFVMEPLWTQFLPLTATSQYLLFWYAAETVPADVEASDTNATHNDGAASSSRVYTLPPAFPASLSLNQRIEQDKQSAQSDSPAYYEPLRHPSTGVDEEELLYDSHLLSIADARQKLRGTVMEDVIRRGWEAIERRMEMEDNEAPLH